MILFIKIKSLKNQLIHISPDDRGYYFGDGVYEVFRVYDGELFAKEAHFATIDPNSRSNPESATLIQLSSGS